MMEVLGVVCEHRSAKESPTRTVIGEEPSRFCLLRRYRREKKRAMNSNCARNSCCFTGVVIAMLLGVLASSPCTFGEDKQQHSVVVRLDAKSIGLTPDEFTVQLGNKEVKATLIQASPDIPRNIAIVIDAGPNQTKVLPRERELGAALVQDLSDGSTSFSIVRAGISGTVLPATSDRSAAIGQIQEIVGDSGKKSNVAIYDAIGSAIRQISMSPGLRIVIFIGEGNDAGSSLRHEQLRSLAETNHVAFSAALVADHSLRGSKSILRYGWDLRELAGDTAGIFIENQKTPKALRRLNEGVRGLHLITFEIPSAQSGRYKVSVASKSVSRLHGQKAIVFP